MSSRWAHEGVARRARQWPTLERLIERVEASPLLEGMVLVGSFANGQVDPLSDLDLVVAVPQDGFEAAWAARGELYGGSALVAWDQRDPGFEQAGAHKWLTRDLVLVECLLSTVSSGVRLADPAVVIAGDPGLRDRFPRRSPITRAEIRERPIEVHEIERAYDELKRAARAALRTA
ncbi:MAG TPA: nucleotidyltransferase domain-containing protein [Actinomycetota bacterium]|nr:nucleotidyltransferase domain-containing protein [Actinomycetota bacterium]